jgi:hypothetical protein
MRADLQTNNIDADRGQTGSGPLCNHLIGDVAIEQAKPPHGDVQFLQIVTGPHGQKDP